MAGGAEEDPLEMEDKYHDPDQMVSMNVIEHEVKYLELMKLKHKDNDDILEFFEMRMESL